MANLSRQQGLMIERKIEGALYTNEHREHLGASILGYECMRHIWYAFRWSKAEVRSARMQRLLNRGHMEEIVVIEDLINNGCKVTGIAIDDTIRDRFKTVFGIDLPTSKQKEATFAYGFGGGACDGNLYRLIDAPKTDHLLEVKTSNTKNFNSMKLKGLEKSNYQHFVQVQIYMHIFKLKRCLYVMVCKENDERYYERIKYQPKVAKKYIKKAEYIVTSEAPPMRIRNNPDFYLCKWCLFKGICHRGENPERNCRTCKNVCFESDGANQKVKCLIHYKILKYKKQVKGCKQYYVNPVYG